MIMYMIKYTEFNPPTYTLRSNPPHDGIPEELVAELDISTIEGDETEVKAILHYMQGASPFV